MKQVVMCVKDRAADTFGRPFNVPAVAAGVRSFTDEINRSADDNQMYKHADDFDLFELGVFDDTTGLYECGAPTLVVRGKDVAVRQDGDGNSRQLRVV